MAHAMALHHDALLAPAKGRSFLVRGVGSALGGQLGEERPRVGGHDIGVLHGDEVASAWEDGVAPQVGEVALGQLPGRDRPGGLRQGGGMSGSRYVMPTSPTRMAF